MKLPSTLPLAALHAALLVTFSINIVLLHRLSRNPTVDNRSFSYEGDDYPLELPINLDTVALQIEDSTVFGMVNPGVWGAWMSMHAFPRAFGFVQLGPNKRKFGVSMFHQLHCLDRMRIAVINGQGGEHIAHCFNLIRQAILCAADTTLDPLKDNGKSTNGLHTTHVCRDWSQVYDFVKENQLATPAADWSGNVTMPVSTENM